MTAMRAFLPLGLVVLGLWMLTAGTARAQSGDAFYVQVEAQRTLSGATDRARAYAAQLPDVTGHFLGTGWYGIALGPYSEADANRLLRQLRGAGLIPADSYIVSGDRLQQQFWPIGTGAATAPQPLPEAIVTAPETAAPDTAAPETAAPETAAVPEPAPAPEPPVRTPDETPREARASEALLDSDARADLQVALQWAGVYSGAIDAAFGRGTRTAMAAWQEANGHEPTGVLTTGQRAELLAAYNSVLDGMDLRLVRDDKAGIALPIPTGAVRLSGYEPPFARYDAVSDDLPAQVLLISQPGTETRLAGFYEILQTLEIIPTEGPRERSRTGFTIEGRDAVRHSWAEATLQDGAIKGFVLVWPAGDDERRSRILSEMRDGFARIDGLLDPALAPPGEDQAIDLLSGLEIRRPQRSRSGVYIDGDGTVLTAAEAVAGCGRITIDEVHEATVAHLDAALGLAVLRPVTPLAPLAVAEFQTTVPRLQAEVAVAGFPYGGILSAPTLTFGRLADIRGLQGEEEVKRLDLAAQDGDVGGPLFDAGGAVLGILAPRPGGDGQVLPPEVALAVDSDAIIGSLAGAGIGLRTTSDIGFLAPETLTLRAADMTVLVGCW